MKDADPLMTQTLQGQANTYRICSKYSRLLRELPNTVTFVSQNADLDLPDPRYLKMHAACCRVAHMSGAAKYIDDIMANLDEGHKKVLSVDGLDGKYLDFALRAYG
jgi:hypothetical protein